MVRPWSGGDGRWPRRWTSIGLFVCLSVMSHLSLWQCVNQPEIHINCTISIYVYVHISLFLIFPPRWVQFSLHYILLIDNYMSCWWYTTESFKAAIQHLANECSIANELQVDGSPLLIVRRASLFNVHAFLMCYVLSSGCFVETKMMFWTPTLCSMLHIVLHSYATSWLLFWSLPHQNDEH